MGGSGSGAVVRGGAGWEALADEAISVRASYSLPILPLSYPFPIRTAPTYSMYCIYEK
jgi:hypothetical protein